MNYTDLLAQQEREREQLHVSRYNEFEAIKALQKASPVPENFEPEKQRILDHYVDLERAMNQRHAQERNAMIPNKTKEKDQKKQAHDMTDKYNDLLEQYKQKQREREQKARDKGGFER